ncbi:MAG: hypothetical protein QXS02_01220 [Candidatus Thermoplasmatota archaeon]
MTRTYLGLNENLEAAFCYIGLWGTGLLFLLLDDRDRFIRFHALQSVLLFLPLTFLFFIVKYTCGLIPFLGVSVQNFLNTLFFFFVIILCSFLMIKALQGERFKAPFVGDIAERYAYKGYYKLKM